MGWGSLLVSVAVLIGVIAYVAHPLLRPSSDPDRVVEAWVAQLRSEPTGPAYVSPHEPPLVAEAIEDAEGALSFCPGCGRRVERDHAYCPKCGRQLTRGETA